ncbi:hypothetical protein BH24ACT8_BH24ACT8_07350 [soil metagenome]
MHGAESVDVVAGVAARFDLGPVLGARQVARGPMGEIHRVDTGTGSFAVKRLLWEVPEESDVQQEVAFAARCRAGGVRVPRAHHTPDGQFLLAGREPGTAWRVYDWVGGSAPSRHDRAAASWLVAQLAIIHRLADDSLCWREVAPWYVSVSTDWTGMMDRAEVTPGADWTRVLSSSHGDLVTLSEWTNSHPPGQPVGTHRDLKLENTLVAPGGGRWLLDWDNVGPLAPWRELGGILADWWEHPEAIDGLARTYRESGGPAYPREPGIFASGVAQRLNFLAAQVEILLDASARPGDRHFAHGVVTGILSGLPRLRDLERAAEGLA